MRVLVTGGNGFIGKALVPKLIAAGHEVLSPTRKECNLYDAFQVKNLLENNDIEAIIHLAGKVGGILANKRYPSEYMVENLSLNTVFLEQARLAGIKRLIYSFCGCSYSSSAPNPIREDSLFFGLPDENAMYYSIGKATSHFQILAYRKEYRLDWVSLVPGNVYGPYDDFSEENSHVIPGLIRKFFMAKKTNQNEIVAWGTGNPVRDFIYVDDVAEAFVIALEKHHESTPINVSSGKGIPIKDLVDLIRENTGFKGGVRWDRSKPDGHPIKVFDTTRMKSILNFEPKTDLRTGIRKTIAWFEKHLEVAVQ